MLPLELLLEDELEEVLPDPLVPPLAVDAAPEPEPVLPAPLLVVAPPELVLELLVEDEPPLHPASIVAAMTPAMMLSRMRVPLEEAMTAR